MSIDTDSNPLLTSYLSERARGNGALYRLLRKPDHQNGLAHTPREIAQQPFLWRETAQMMKERAGELRSFLARAGLFGDNYPPHVNVDEPSIDKGLYSRTVKGVHIYGE